MSRLLKEVRTLEKDIRSTLSKLEHRSEVLMEISRNRSEFGQDEIARAYRKQAIASSSLAQSIRELLVGMGDDRGGTKE